MLRYHIAFHLPCASSEMVVAEALDFPGAVTQGFDLSDARLMIASAMEDLAQSSRGRQAPADPNPDASAEAGLTKSYRSPSTANCASADQHKPINDKLTIWTGAPAALSTVRPESLAGPGAFGVRAYRLPPCLSTSTRVQQ